MKILEPSAPVLACEDKLYPSLDDPVVAVSQERRTVEDGQNFRLVKINS